MARILVVDDAPRVLEAARGILSEAGHEVLLCACGKHALQILQGESVQLLVTDIYMPDIDGLELIRDAHRTCPMVPILAMQDEVGWPDMLHIAKCLGASHTLQKPFSTADLLAAVTVLLRKSGADCRSDSECGPLLSGWLHG
jgi:DNA-binding response OmpR family regulator